jgi:HK97 gp10 family phage protein
MKQFGNITDFVEHLAALAIAEEIAIRKGLNQAAKLVEKEAKAEIGNYQDEIGPFIAWPELAEATKTDRIRHGYSEDDPLLRTGDLRDSIGTVISTDGMEAQVGSNSDIAVYQELGTEHIPPRSFLGGAMARKLPEVKEILGASLVAGLVGERVFNRFLPIED